MIRTILKFIGANPLWVAIGIVATVAIGSFTRMVHTRHVLEAKADSLALEVLNQRAEAAVTENIREGLVAKLAIQQKLLADTVDALLKQQPKAKVVMRVKTDTVEVEAAGPTQIIEGGVRVARTQGYNAPYHFRIEVAVPPPPAESQFRIGLALDPMALEVHIGCVGTDRIRAARVGVRGPDWADISVVDARTEPEVCSMPRHAGPRVSKFWRIPAGAAAGALAALVSGGSAATGAFVGGGVGVVFTFAF